MGALLAQTSPPNMAAPGEVAAGGADRAPPPRNGGTGTADAGAPADAGSGAPAPVPVQNPTSLTVKGTGALEGSYKVSQYWPVTKYWGTDDQLGKFDEPSSGGWRMIGHKFQVIGQFTSGTTTTGAGGKVTFLQEARITNTKGGTAGSWFDDMDYTDAGGGKHTWDPNAEAGTTVKTGYPGVRRTLGTDKYAYTDPPAMGYRPGTTNAYRKLRIPHPPEAAARLERLGDHQDGDAGDRDRQRRADRAPGALTVTQLDRIADRVRHGPGFDVSPGGVAAREDPELDALLDSLDGAAVPELRARLAAERDPFLALTWLRALRAVGTAQAEEAMDEYAARLQAGDPWENGFPGARELLRFLGR